VSKETVAALVDYIRIFLYRMSSYVALLPLAGYENKFNRSVQAD
jgi:hypothetical protein